MTSPVRHQDISDGNNKSLLSVSSPFQVMRIDPGALDRLDIRFRWGHYGIQVLRCHLITFAGGHVIQPHKHHDYELHFIPQGSGKLVLADGSHTLCAGLFYVTGPNVVHQQEADTWDPMHELCLHVNIVRLTYDDEHAQQHLYDDSPHNWGEAWESGEAEECVRQLNAMRAHPTEDQYDAMSWFVTAYRAWHDRELGGFSTIRQAIIQILLRAARAHHVTQINTALPVRDMNAYRYQLATQYIRDNYTHPLTLEEVADELHISGRQLQRIFHEQDRETFSSYLERYRLAQVQVALMKTDLTIEMLAKQHGFSNSRYLHYVFKKRTGLTPLHYREQQRQDETSLWDGPYI